ncbi:hypothetical protein Taro_044479, partial [Colocasia esculenta]|nr:hypothetical protein [Colocasia esculenta]
SGFFRTALEFEQTRTVTQETEREGFEEPDSATKHTPWFSARNPCPTLPSTTADGFLFFAVELRFGRSKLPVCSSTPSSSFRWFAYHSPKPVKSLQLSLELGAIYKNGDSGSILGEQAYQIVTLCYFSIATFLQMAADSRIDERQHIAIFTTASLPWMTGTAVNPLFRAAYLEKYGGRKATLVIPWLSIKDQELVYPSKITFDSPEEQESYIRQWLEERTGFTSGFNICFYFGKYSTDKMSILAVGDITEIIPDEEADIAVLEEPEHLTWYHHGQRWKTKFRRVIGVVHTNYLEYVKREKNGHVHAFFLKYINNWLTHIYCHKIIRLSAATQTFPKSIICNVHGVNPRFIEIGKMKEIQQKNGAQVFTKGAYYIGKMVWNKGYRELLQLLAEYQNQLSSIEVDLYGNGENSDEVQQTAKKLKMTVRVFPGRDHTDPLFHDYKVFINPSTTDVVCTTTAEALAMGKIVVCANHPSNEFFKQFPNCRVYGNKGEFLKVTLKALADEPMPMTDDQRHELSWEAATERFLKAADLNQLQVPSEKPIPSSRLPKSLSLKLRDLKKKIEDASASVHFVASGNEKIRCAFGAIPGSLQLDEQQSEELGLSYAVRRQSSSC